MSQKFLTDNGLLRGVGKIKQGSTSLTDNAASDMPPYGSGGFPAGFLFLHETVGRAFVNIGTSEDAIFTDGFVNRYSLVDRHDLLPKLIAAHDLNATFSHTEGETLAYANKNFVISGTNASADDVTLADGGGWKLETDGASNDQVLVGTVTTTPGPGTSAWWATKWNTNDEVIFEEVVTTGSSVAAITIYAGLKLTSTPVVATDNDQAYFRFSTADTNATKWACVTSRSGTDVEVDSGVTVEASTTYHLMVKIDKNRVPHFYINGVEVGLSTPGSAALTADVDLRPMFGLQALTGAAKHVYFRGTGLSKSYND